VVRDLSMRFILAILFGVLASAALGARLELVTSVPLVRAREVVFDGDFAWVAQNMDGATLLDVTDPAKPRVVRQFSPEEMQPLSLTMLTEDNLLVSADRFRGLVIYDVGVADQPTTILAYPLPGMTTQIDVTHTTDGKRLAVLARTGMGLLCFDITDPTSPTLTDEFTMGMEFTRSVVTADGIVYAADGSYGGLKALRLVSPGKFEPLYKAMLSGPCETLMIDGNRLIAGYLMNGFKVFELPDPSTVVPGTTPILKLISSSLRNRSRVRTMATSGTLMVVANEEISVDLYDMKNPALPCLGDEFRFMKGGILAQSCSIYRDTVYVPAWEAGLLVFRINDEPTPAKFNLENVDYVGIEQ